MMKTLGRDALEMAAAPGGGHVALQNEGTVIEFRNIHLRPLGG